MLHWQADSLPLSRRYQRHRFNPWVWNKPWSRKWQPTPVFFPGKFHGPRSLWAKVHGVQSLTWLSMLCKTMKERELALGRQVEPIKILCSLLQRGRRRQWQPTPVLLPGKSHGRRSLVGCSPWGCQESDTTERLHFHFSFSCIGEGNGNPLQCSCLENPKGGGSLVGCRLWGRTESDTTGKKKKRLDYIFCCCCCFLKNDKHFHIMFQIRSDQSHQSLFATPWIAARQASLSITNSRSSLRLTSIKSVMPSSHLILCRPLLLLPSIPPSIRVFSNESTLHMRWPKYWSFSFTFNFFLIQLQQL